MSWLTDYFKYAPVAGIPGSLVVNQIIDLPAASAVPGREYIILNPGNNTRAIPWKLLSNGSIFQNAGLQNLASSAVSLGYVAINQTTFGTPSAVTSGSNGTGGGAGSSTKITGVAAGSHGLTNAVSLGKYINITGGTGWTAGLYKIVDVDADTNIVEVDIPFTSQGIPTYSTKTAEVELFRIKVPPLNPQSFIAAHFSWSATGSTSKRLRLRYGDAGESFSTATSYSEPNVTTGIGNATLVHIHNQNSKTNQTGAFGNTSAIGSGAGSGSIPTSTKNTALQTDIIFTANPGTQNEVIQLERYHILVNY